MTLLARLLGRPGHRFAIGVALAALVGLAIRVGYAFLRERQIRLTGDARFYHAQANALADGHAFIEPFALSGADERFVPSAAHPPAFTVVLAGASRLGWRGEFDHVIVGAVIGAFGVVVIGLAARAVAGDSAGIVAAMLAAVSPDLWLNDVTVMSETLVILFTALIIWLTYRFVHAPTVFRAAVLGIACGVATLTRAELLLLAPLAFATLIWARRATPARAARLLGVGAIATAATIAPWTIYNGTRFNHPVIVSNTLGWTMWGTNCASTYDGPLLGYWSYACSSRGAPIAGDATDADRVLRRRALRYMATHAGRVPFVVAARIGRGFGLYRPYATLGLEGGARRYSIAVAGLTLSYLLLPFAIAGAFVVRARRVPLSPLLAPFLTAAVAIFIAGGQQRLRAGSDVSLVVLASLALVTLARAVTPNRAS